MAFEKDQRKAWGAVHCFNCMAVHYPGKTCWGVDLVQGENVLRPADCAPKAGQIALEGMLGKKPEGYCDKHDLMQPCTTCTPPVKCGPGGEPCYYGKGESIRCTLPNGHEGEHAMRLDWYTDYSRTKYQEKDAVSEEISDPTMSRDDLIFIVGGSAIIFALGAAFGLLLGVMLF